MGDKSTDDKTRPALSLGHQVHSKGSENQSFHLPNRDDSRTSFTELRNERDDTGNPARCLYNR